MKPASLIVALIFTGVTAIILAQCVNSWAGDAGRQGEYRGADSSSMGGICGCQGTNAPLSGTDIGHDPDVTSNDPTGGACGCVP